MSVDPGNDFRSGDTDNNLLRKILTRLLTLIGAVETVVPTIIIDPGEVEIGSVMLKDGVGGTLAAVQAANPVGTEPALVTRNIPSGTQTVTGTVNVGNLPATQPVSGTVTVTGSVSVSNLPATQPVSGTVAVSNFPATQPVSGTVAVSNFPATQSVLNEHDIANPMFDASILGHLHTGTERAAFAYHVLGRRAGFNSTSVLQDVAEFLGTSIDAMPELTGAESLEVVSSSASDTLAGTGAQKIRIAYISNANNLVIGSDISLNGATPVATGFTAKFILWMEVTQVGTNSVSVGNVILRVVGPGATHEQITAGGNRSMSCRFMVPTGYTAYIQGWQAAAVGTATQDVRLRATVKTGDRALNTAYLFQDNGFLVAGSQMSVDLPWLKLPALTRVKVSTISSAAPNTNRIDSDISILLVQD